MHQDTATLKINAPLLALQYTVGLSLTVVTANLLTLAPQVIAKVVNACLLVEWQDKQMVPMLKTASVVSTQSAAPTSVQAMLVFLLAQ